MGGEMFPQSSPLLETWVIKNDDEKSHEMAVKVLDWIKKASEHESATPETKATLEKTVAQGVPAMGEPFELLLPQVIVNQIHHMTEILQGELASITDSVSQADFDKYVKEKVPEIGARTIAHLVGKYKPGTTWKKRWNK